MRHFRTHLGLILVLETLGSLSKGGPWEVLEDSENEVEKRDPPRLSGQVGRGGGLSLRKETRKETGDQDQD